MLVSILCTQEAVVNHILVEETKEQPWKAMPEILDENERELFNLKTSPQM